MATINFKLREYTKNNPCKIQVDVVWPGPGNRVQKSTGQPVERKDWSNEKQRVKAAGKMANPINTLLGKIESDILNYFINCQSLKVSPDKKKIETLISRIDSIKESELIEDMITVFIADSKSGERKTEKGKMITEKTIEEYGYTFKLLKSFMAVSNVKVLHQLTARFLSDWQVWQSTGIGKKGDENYKPRYADNYLTNNAYIFNAFVTYLEKLGKGPFPRARKWTHRVDKVVIYPSEVKLLLEWSPQSEIDRYTRDIFTVGIMTCLRVSNLLTLKRKNVMYNINGASISYVIKKTQQPHAIKLSRVANVIVSNQLSVGESANDLVFPDVSKTEYNRRLKDMALAFGNHLKEIGVTTENDWLGSIPKTTYYLGVPDTQYVPFAKMISSHTARRSGITGPISLGYAPSIVGKVSGHVEGSESLASYVEISQQHADKMLNAVWD